MLNVIWRDKMREKKYRPSPLLTKRNWPKELKVGFDGDFTLLYGYMDCVEREVPALEKMIKKAKSFEELKEDLLNHIKRQKEFVEDVKIKRSSVFATDYGLPRIPR